jgi:hypothetical protein
MLTQSLRSDNEAKSLGLKGQREGPPDKVSFFEVLGRVLWRLFDQH